MSDLEETLAEQLRQRKETPPFVREYRFHSVRQWKFDFAWPEYRIAAEVEGGVEQKGWMTTKDGRRVPKQSRHSTPKGFREDCEKYNTAAINGWKVLRFPPSMVNCWEKSAAKTIGLAFANLKMPMNGKKQLVWTADA